MRRQWWALRVGWGAFREDGERAVLLHPVLFPTRGQERAPPATPGLGRSRTLPSPPHPSPAPSIPPPWPADLHVHAAVSCRRRLYSPQLTPAPALEAALCPTPACPQPPTLPVHRQLPCRPPGVGVAHVLYLLHPDVDCAARPRGSGWPGLVDGHIIHGLDQAPRVLTQLSRPPCPARPRWKCPPLPMKKALWGPNTWSLVGEAWGRCLPLPAPQLPLQGKAGSRIDGS